MGNLNYYRPAKNWFQALPVGNGKTAVMVFGGSSKETLCFNDAELWSGYPKINDNPDRLPAFQNARKLIFDKNYSEAHKCVQNRCCGDYSEAYMPLGELSLKFSQVIKGSYNMRLDLNNGLVEINAGSTRRKAFVSFPHNVAVYSIESDKKFSVAVNLKSKLKSAVAISDSIISLYGNAPDYAAPNYVRNELRPIRYDEGKAMAFCLAVKIVTDGNISVCGDGLKAENATFVRLYGRTATGFKGYKEYPDCDAEKLREQTVSEISSFDVDYEKVLSDHVADYKNLFDRQSLSLADGDGDALKLLKDAKKGNLSPELINLLYDYGKYLTICGSRDSQPLNLQGQWNISLRPPWSSNLTVNINFEMNYWGASSTGLTECLEPFYRAVKEISERGEKTATNDYGARGFCCNHNSDIWRHTETVKGDPMYMFEPLCGAWLANEVFSHKKNSGNIDKEATKIISSAALFCLDYLTEYENKLTPCPSASPETKFIYGKALYSLSHGSTFELSVIKQCFLNCLDSGEDENLKQEISTALSRLYPLTEAENGIAEWAEGKTSAEKGHRHFSPLYGVYPGNFIKEASAEYEPCRKLFLHRLSYARSSIGWSAVWAICLAARFSERDIAENILKKFAARSVMRNLFDYHPPAFFQIDGNLGFVAAVNELLIREDDGVVTLLPACPEIIKNGSVRGFVINGKKIDFDWKNGEITYVNSDKDLEIRAKNLSKNATLNGVKIRND